MWYFLIILTYYFCKIKQKTCESIQVYAERLVALSEDAFDNVGAADQQLIVFFINGLSHDYMKMKVMRVNPAMLQAAIAVANAEQNLGRRIDLRSGHQPQLTYDRSYEPMEIDHAQPKYFRHHKQGHKPKECQSGHAASQSNNSNNSVRPRTAKNIICWICHKRGHNASQCISRGDLVSTGSSKKEIQSVIRATIVTFSCRGCYKSKVIRLQRSGIDKPIYIVALSGGQNFCQLKIQKQKSRVLLDTGAEVSLMNRHVFDSLKDKPRLHNKHAFLPTVNGEPLKLDGCTEINFEIEGIKMSHSFFVVCVININQIL